MFLQHKVKVSFESEAVYLMDGIICRQEKALAVTTSSQRIMLYDVTTSGHMMNVTGHTQPITDLVAGNVNSDIIFSIQQDTGAMITDLRVGKAVHFLTELTGSGKTGNTLCIDPTDTKLTLAAGGDIHTVDCRTWHSCGLVEELHADDVTRMRYCGPTLLCSAGEDQMINIFDTSKSEDEDDMMLVVINCGESCHKMRCFPQYQFVGLTGTCENAYVLPVQPDASERKLPRRDERSYVVDFVDNGDTVLLAIGAHAPEVDDSAPVAPSPPVGPIDLVDVKTGVPVASLQNGHQDVVRVIARSGNTLLTAGEDGLVAWWGSTKASPASSESMHSDGSGMKQRASVKPVAGRQGRPY